MSLTAQLPQGKVINHQLAERLSSFNQLSRELRALGIRPVTSDVVGNRIVVDLLGAKSVMQHFGAELRGVMLTSDGGVRMKKVKLRGVDVCWLSLGVSYGR